MPRLPSRFRRISPRSWRNLFALCVPFALGLMLLLLTDSRESITPERIRLEILAMGGLGLFGFLLAATLRPLFVILSSSLFSIAAGMVWGVGWGIALAIAGALLSTSLVFLLARSFGIGAVCELAGDKWPRFSGMAQARGFAFVFLSTLGFALPADLVIAVAACSGVRARTVLAGATLGALPGTVAMVATGSMLIRSGAASWWLGGGAAIGLTLVSLLLARLWFPRIRVPSEVPVRAPLLPPAARRAEG